MIIPNHNLPVCFYYERSHHSCWCVVYNDTANKGSDTFSCYIKILCALRWHPKIGRRIEVQGRINDFLKTGPKLWSLISIFFSNPAVGISWSRRGVAYGSTLGQGKLFKHEKLPGAIRHIRTVLQVMLLPILKIINWIIWRSMHFPQPAEIRGARSAHP